MTDTRRAGSGDGFVTVADGGVRWGRYGAAGILARSVDEHGEASYFLARRSMLCHRGGTWGIPGGALDAGESPLEGALREFAEEIHVLPEPYTVTGVHEDDHGGWSYWTITIDVDDRFPEPAELGWETDDARWVAAGDLHALPLFDAFADTLTRLAILPDR
ncbi:MAG: NUDIX domain-containing protein [Acidimicrobiales bacterium]